MSQPTPPAANRRTARRQQPKRTTKVICRRGNLGIGPNLVHSLLDLSEGGLRALSHTPLQPGESLEVTIEALWLRQPLRREGEVVWCLETAARQHVVGIKFHKRLSYADFQGLTYV
jgi:hypothetical protein